MRSTRNYDGKLAVAECAFSDLFYCWHSFSLGTQQTKMVYSLMADIQTIIIYRIHQRLLASWLANAYFNTFIANYFTSKDTSINAKLIIRA